MSHKLIKLFSILDAAKYQKAPSTISTEDDSTAAPRAFKEEGTPEGLLSSATSLSKLTIDTEDDVEEEEGDNAVSATFTQNKRKSNIYLHVHFRQSLSLRVPIKKPSQRMPSQQ